MARSGITNSTYEAARSLFHRTRKLAFYVTDARQTFRDMRWDGAQKPNYWAKSSELLFQYHKLEKGMCMPGQRRFFGYDPATATLSLLKEWRAADFPVNDPIYMGALETLRAYSERIAELVPEKTVILQQRLNAEFANQPQRFPELKTPRPASDAAREADFETLSLLAVKRRSVRYYDDMPVSVELVKKAIAVAQLSPSACNRQPCRVHHYDNRDAIDAMLALQNGNRGFGHTVPTLLILTAEATSFFDASERHAPYVDGGLFAMSLILALQAQGISSCCLNWCVEPGQDRAAHKNGRIPESERIVMFIAIGYAAPSAMVPRSPRRRIDNALVQHHS